MKEKEWSLKHIREVVTSELHDGLQKELKKLQLGINHGDKHVQMTVELLNGL